MRTDEKLKEVCDRLTTNCGDLHEAARFAGMSPHFLFAWMKDDREASKLIEEAQRVGWMGLEAAAIQRGVHGIEKAVYYKGEVVGYETQYSDSLLSKLLEARVPAYKKGEDSRNVFNGPTQINMMPRAENFDQWLDMKTRTLSDRAADVKAIEGPKIPEILQGDYVEVSDAARGAYQLMSPGDTDMSVLKGLL